MLRWADHSRLHPFEISLVLGAAALLLVSGCGAGTMGGDNESDVDAGPGDLDPGVDAGDTPDGVDEECTFVPTGKFNPAIECRWDGPSATDPYPVHDDVVMSPVVMNLTDDNGNGAVDVDDIPDIAFISYPLQRDDCPAGATCGCCNSSGVLRIVSGSCDSGNLRQHFVVGPEEIAADTGGVHTDIWLDNSGGLAVGDIDNDGSADIVATIMGGGTIAFERNGTVKWVNREHPVGADNLAGSQPALANLVVQGVNDVAEVIQGRVVLRGDTGALVWRGDFGLGTNGFMGPVTTAGDLDLDGSANLLAGNTMYDNKGNKLWAFEFPYEVTSSNCQSQGYPCDGFTATGNFDADDFGEAVIARAGEIYVVNHDGSLMQHGGIDARIPIPVSTCGKNEGGPPTVADFDGDGEAEIGVAGANYYVVADFECFAAPLPDHCVSQGIRWQVENKDCSSRVTGSSVFDFDGDGRAEVIYNDETTFRILDGIDGRELVAEPNRSHTRLEMPVIADVDNDGNAEIVFVENGDSPGVRIWGDETDSWVPTRRVWNQHSYHVTNVSELGVIPVDERVNWLSPTENTVSGYMNNFRQNLPEQNVLLAPDLTVAVQASHTSCDLKVTVCNEGAIHAGANIPIRLYDRVDGLALECDGGPLATTAPLQPGSCEEFDCALSERVDSTVEIRACVDNEGYSCTSGNVGGNNECREGNNLSDDTVALSCAVID
jgi:hypothetical protein